VSSRGEKDEKFDTCTSLSSFPPMSTASAACTQESPTMTTPFAALLSLGSIQHMIYIKQRC
jgi:hypothetical protein